MKNLAGAELKELLAKWKKEHGEVIEITVTDKENKKATCFLKSPNRNVAAMAMTLISQNKLVETGEHVVNNCWLGGNERCRKEEKVAVATALQAAGLIEFYDAEVKKH